MSTTRFKITELSEDGGKVTPHYFDSLFDAINSNIFNSVLNIIEVDEKGKELTSLFHYTPDNYWRIANLSFDEDDKEIKAVKAKSK